jgi:hypothetical protein
MVTIAAAIGLGIALVAVEHRAAALWLAIPTAFIILLAVQSLSGWPRLSAIALGIAALLTLILGRGSPGQFWQTWLAIAGALAVYLLAWNALLKPYINKEAAGQIQTLNGDATPRALVVYHAGRSTLQQRACTALARALADNGWRVDVATIGGQAPTRVKCYDLLVLGTPTYEWLPADRMRQYLREVADLRGRPTVLIISAMGMPEHAVAAMERLVSAAGGRVVRSLPIRVRNNARSYGTNDLEEIMRHEAAALDIPVISAPPVPGPAHPVGGHR